MDYKQEINEASQGFNDEAVYLLEQGYTLDQIQDDINKMVLNEAKRLTEIIFTEDGGFIDFLRGSSNNVDKYALNMVLNETESTNPKNAYKFMKEMITEIVRLDLFEATFPLDIEN